MLYQLVSSVCLMPTVSLSVTLVGRFHLPLQCAIPFVSCQLSACRYGLLPDSTFHYSAKFCVSLSNCLLVGTACYPIPPSITVRNIVCLLSTVSLSVRLLTDSIFHYSAQYCLSLASCLNVYTNNISIPYFNTVNTTASCQIFRSPPIEDRIHHPLQCLIGLVSCQLSPCLYRPTLSFFTVHNTVISLPESNTNINPTFLAFSNTKIL